MATASKKNHYIGGGKGYFKPDGKTGYYDLGNITDSKLTGITVDKIQHKDTSSFPKQTDLEIIREITANLNVTVDKISVTNFATFCIAETEDITQTSGTITDLSISVDTLDALYDLGKRNIDPESLVVANTGETITYVEGTDYELIAAQGLLKVLKGGAITAGTSILVNADYEAVSNLKSINAGLNAGVSGEYWFIGNAVDGGRQIEFKQRVTLFPTGDLPMMTEEFMTLSFESALLKMTGGHLFQMIVEAD